MRHTCKVPLLVSSLAIGSVLSAPLARAATSIEFLSPSPVWTVTEKDAVFQLKANQAQMVQTKCWISDFKDDAGHPIQKSLFPCKLPDPLPANNISNLHLDLSQGNTLPPGTYSLALEVLGLDNSGATIIQSTTFRFIVPAITFKIGDTDGIRIPVLRRNPLAVAKAFMQITPIVTGAAAPTQPIAPLPMQLYVQDADAKNLVQGGEGTAGFISDGSPACTSPACPGGTLGGKLLQLDFIVPPGVQKATATLRLQSSQLASISEIPVTLLVKDYWMWGAIAVVCGQFLSFWVNQWITVGRQRKLNKLSVAPVEASLIDLLVNYPFLDSSKDAVDIRNLLDSAIQANNLGDVASAKDSIAQASQKLTALHDAALNMQAPSGPTAIVLLQKGEARVGRQLNFVLADPDKHCDPGTIFKWELLGLRHTLWDFFKDSFRQGWMEGARGAKQMDAERLTAAMNNSNQWRTLAEAQDLKNISKTLWRSGQYSIRISRNDVQFTSLPFRLDRDESVHFLAKIQWSDTGILLLAVVFSSLLSFLAIEKLDTFGSISDYALAFLGGFGLNATTSGFGAVVSRFKAGPS
jgi:hypothetical protein